MSAERSPSSPSGARAVDFSLLVVILAVALAARCWYLTAGVPYAVGIDEPQVVNRSLRILQTGDWNPHVFDYPTLVIYFHAAVAILRGQLARRRGVNEERPITPFAAVKADEASWRRYPHLYAALEAETSAVVANIENTRAEIDRLSQTVTGREKERARVALIAYERALELYRCLAELRDQARAAASNMGAGTAITE